VVPLLSLSQKQQQKLLFYGSVSARSAQARGIAAEPPKTARSGGEGDGANSPTRAKAHLVAPWCDSARGAGLAQKNVENRLHKFAFYL
jgi:hypothetical protein